MRIDVHLYIDGSAPSWVADIQAQLKQILTQGTKIMSLQDEIRDAFTQETADEQKIISLLQSTLSTLQTSIQSNRDLADQLAAAIANQADPVQMQALLDQIRANNAAMETEIATAAPQP